MPNYFCGFPLRTLDYLFSYREIHSGPSLHASKEVKIYLWKNMSKTKRKFLNNMQSIVNQKVNVVVPTHIANQLITFFQPEDRFLNTVVATTFLNPKSLLNIAVVLCSKRFFFHHCSY